MQIGSKFHKKTASCQFAQKRTLKFVQFDQTPRRGMRNAECRVRNAECTMHNAQWCVVLFPFLKPSHPLRGSSPEGRALKAENLKQKFL